VPRPHHHFLIIVTIFKYQITNSTNYQSFALFAQKANLTTDETQMTRIYKVKIGSIELS